MSVPGLFEAFEAVIGVRARRLAALQGQANRLARQLQRASGEVDLHTMRQKASDAASRAMEASTAATELAEVLRTFSLLPAGAVEAAASAETDAAGGMTGAHEEYARAFEQALVTEGVAFQGNFPAYQVFPFTVRVRLEEERALFGRRASYLLRPDALARKVRTERDRIHGATFQADRFGRSLLRAIELVDPESEGRPVRRAPLGKIYEVLSLGNFGRNSYTRDEFAFDVYRYRQQTMLVNDWRLSFVAGHATGAIAVPNTAGSFDNLQAVLAQRVGDHGI